MKNSKLFLSAFAVFVIVGSALAFNTSRFGDGSVFCTDNGNTCSVQKNFRPEITGTEQAPCGRDGASNPLPVYIYTGTDCIAATGPYKTTALGN